MIMNEPYSHITTSDYLLNTIRSQCNNETRLCVGGADAVTETLQLVACGNCYVITSTTDLNTPNLENGVYWYYTPAVSFGFSPIREINQAAADLLTLNGDKRLSWPTATGGYRIGRTKGAAAERKIMFIRNYPIATQQPLAARCTSDLECASTHCVRNQCNICPSEL